MQTATAKKKSISLIPSLPEYDRSIKPQFKALRVAAYCRVSTTLEQQETSYEAQVSYYTEKIKSNPNWKLAGIYADDGKSATNTKKRDDFNAMIEDCMAGKIDMIITKSVSRFARNTVDSLQNIRKLKEKNVAVFFEKEGVNTLEGTGELLITILSSQAQEESRNLSENTRWGLVRRFENGIVSVNHNKFLGYTKDKNGELVIVPEESELVRRIFRLYLEGSSIVQITKLLESEGITTVTGLTKWCPGTINKMLSNEKYCGDVLLQKTITVDFLKHKRVDNKGQAPKYYIEGNHQPIISKEMFDKVQDEKERRALLKGNLVGDRHKYSSRYPFSGKVFCAHCGNIFKRRHWNSTNESKKVVWQCKTYIMNGKDACGAKAVSERGLMDIFLQMFNNLYENRDEFIKTLTENIERIILQKPDIIEAEALDKRIEELKNELKRLIRFQVNNNVDPEVYNEEYKSISEELGEVRKKRLEHDKVTESKDGLKQRFDEILETINSKDSLLEEFDKEIFNALVEKIEILAPMHFVFELKSGMRVGEIEG